MSDGLDHRQRVNPWLFDGAIVAALLTVGLLSMFVNAGSMPSYRPGDALGVLLIALTTVPVLFRRVAPVSSGLVLAATTLLYLVWDYASLSSTPAMLIAVYSAGAYAVLAPGLVVLASHFTVTMVYLASIFNTVDVVGPVLVNLCFAILGYTGAWAIGRGMRNGRLYTAQLRDRAERLEGERTAEVRVALAEERSRIARELHDVVAHHVSVMTVQAAGAQRSLESSPARSSEALRSIETTGRAALTEMRRIVGVLRSPERTGQIGAHLEAHRGPQPGVADLEGLADQMRATGIDVTLIHKGDTGDLPAGVDVTVFRIVQEALTNALKHAGPASVQVSLERASDSITVRVRDDGRGMAAQLEARRPGHGLLGIRERVAIYGGVFMAGPRHGGGYEVHARIPCDSVEQSTVQ
ncbi:sensor histidine kinase [Phytoactinopolyspora alkaliphila]|uniref:histidine kinase n=1 Tax=Phytoactinopolyspora alkaliphila TaxID=1783498 RepID=A0A6N9YH30_9ACTN|nr:sensor histidine kinase [Phytoactinopolyspora alkaliphila]NED94218.1 sensor histidine kinase [Phytoactinopolyspora alkaliphila]